ncbi:MAG TPA: tetratricopeptide repeat-containing glycosyltransferase family protein [Stellaceae bacterium]
MTETGAEPSLALPEIPAGPMPVQAQPAPEVTSAEPPASAADRLLQLMQVAGEHETAGRLAEAHAVLRHVLTEAPSHHPALHLLGIVAFRQGDGTEAARLIEQSIALAPTVALYHRNIGEIYRVLGRLDEALIAGRRAAALAPDDVHCYHNLSVLHYHRLELDEAIACGEQALTLNPEFPGAHFGIAEAALLRGDFERGWDEYEWRLKLANAPPLLPPTEQAQWDGNGLDGTLLVVADQGYGDVVQFVRYLPWAAARCARLAVACSAELQPVVAQQLGDGLLFDHWEKAPPFAAFSPLSSLPRLAGTRPETIPAPVPYLTADPGKLAHWAERLDGLLPRGYRRIGIVWAGRPTHHNDRNRSAELKLFQPLTDLPGLALVSLQKGAAQSQIGWHWGRAPLVNLGPELRDYGDTMAVLQCLERVITVDTSVGHLAGAMGKDVWIMLPYAPDWRWLLDRDDSPWYPSVRLLRQGPDRRWEPVMARVVAEIARSRPPQ